MDEAGVGHLPAQGVRDSLTKIPARRHRFPKFIRPLCTQKERLRDDGHLQFAVAVLHSLEETRQVIEGNLTGYKI